MPTGRREALACASKPFPCASKPLDVGSPTGISPPVLPKHPDEREPRMRTQAVVRISALLLGVLFAHSLAAGEWTNWRGPHFTGVSDDTGLISSWSRDGENLIWRADFTGRSTAAVFDGRACAIGRDGEGILRQEVVVCWNAEDGTKLWERRYTPHNSFVPWQRLGWASVAGDSETGNLYIHTSDGVLAALDRKGETVWEWRLGEDIGRRSGYGGRTHTPIVDEDRVIVAAINSNWGQRPRACATGTSTRRPARCCSRRSRHRRPRTPTPSRRR